ncbi:BON domain-containing protein [Dyadobacter jiangsuensis]|uniref:Osmotically-inducible protein OsmY n=1 Tax=Dyadobacter jiangsuensis TaxID=1591085 RepID=A0A2P8GCB1_9BACT|nr:BON domain-containing protein [Dyadobacter jiangsuensis]PSL31612.1 osmotically-inducible protein OsmY [Dyadobacter jiangsuensis]
MKTDFEIQKDVIEQLRWEPALAAAEIGVSVKDGIVTLSGTIDSYPKKLAAEKGARKVSAVKAVIENLEVHLPTNKQKSDQQIADQVLNALRWHTAVADEKLKVTVEHGFVTLSGQVDWGYERNMAKTAIENIEGIRLVVNEITVRPHPVYSDVTEKIGAAFQRHASIDSSKIRICITGNRVTLEGRVRSWAERDDAEEAAWSAKGVNQVVNNLIVEEEEFAF